MGKKSLYPVFFQVLWDLLLIGKKDEDGEANSLLVDYCRSVLLGCPGLTGQSGAYRFL